MIFEDNNKMDRDMEYLNNLFYSYYIYTFFKKKVISKKVSEDFSKVHQEANQLVQTIKNS